MALLDKQAESFVVSYGDKLRRLSFAELSKNLSGQEDRTEIPAPETLKGYRFSLARALLQDGRVRILVRGYRPILWGLSERGVHDGFDIFPNGKVQEIRRSDEDYCGRS